MKYGRPLLASLFCAAGALLVASSAACVETRACTEIGCSDTLTIYFVDDQDEPVESFTGELTFNGESLQFMCSPQEDGVGNYHCHANAVHIYLVPSQAEVTASSSQGALQGATSLSPTYEEHQPNGPGCPPICQSATATVVMTAGSNDGQ